MYLNSQVQEAHGYREEAAIDVEYSTHGSSRKYTFLSLTFYIFFLLFINYYTTFSVVFFFKQEAFNDKHHSFSFSFYLYDFYS